MKPLQILCVLSPILPFAIVGCASPAAYAPTLVQQEDEELAPKPSAYVDRPGRENHELALALSDDSAWLTYTAPIRQSGFTAASIFTNDDDDFATHWRILRTGKPKGGGPVTLGVGMGVYAIFIDKPSDEAFAVVLTGRAAYEFPTGFPTALALEVAYAPDVTTFDDGEGLTDFTAQFEVEISSFATAFFGYRELEVELERGSDYDLVDGIHGGISLGF